MLSKSPNLEYLRSFHMVAECGSISKAVTKNNITRPTLSRHIQLLENELGLVLFRRTKNGLELTEKGSKVFTYSESIFQIATDMFDDVLETKSLLSGPVKVVASNGITSIILSKIFNKLSRLSSDIELHIKPVNEVTEQLLNQNDISIQTVRPTRANLIARKLGKVDCGAYASKNYLNQKGTPVSLSDLKDHYLVGDIQTEEIKHKIDILFGPEIANQIFHLRCDDHSVAWRMVVEGCGIGITHISQGDSEPRVSRILKELPIITYPVWLVTHEEIQDTPRIRYIYDLIAEQFNKV
ncbi:LysR family transcriptional regulator [Rhodobacteraceae bacterium IMCC15231]|nr:LysR family transcriptional regulator [Rhodobacteraceae bacterium IMCC15231]